MKAGQTVTMNRDGQETAVVILEVGEPGPSGLKTLSVAWKDADGAHSRSDLPHERDARSGGHFWREGNPRQNQTTAAAAEADEAAPKKAKTSTK